MVQMHTVVRHDGLAPEFSSENRGTNFAAVTDNNGLVAPELVVCSDGIAPEFSSENRGTNLGAAADNESSVTDNATAAVVVDNTLPLPLSLLPSPSLSLSVPFPLLLLLLSPSSLCLNLHRLNLQVFPHLQVCCEIS